MNISQLMHVVAGETVSIELNSRNADGTLSELAADSLTSELLSLPDMQAVPGIEGEQVQTGGVVLISKLITANLVGRYLVRIRIDNQGLIQVRDVMLRVTR